MKKNKILFLINTLTGGGAEKVLVDVVNNIDTEKNVITVQTVADDGIYKDALKENINYKTIIKFKNPFLKKLFTYVINFIVPPKITYKIFIKCDYDYEVAFLEGIPTKLLSCSTNEKSKKISWVHTDLFNNFLGHEKLFKSFETYIECYRKYDEIICVSESVKQGFLKKFGNFENLKVIYNPCDDKKILECSLENQTIIPNDNVFKIVTVGRLCEQKGYDRLLRIHNKLIHEEYFHKLYILGEGNKRTELEQYIADNNLSETVNLLGFHKNPYKYMKACDLFVCSSYAEGYSTAVTEALILKIPVVSTNCSGAEELLEYGKYGIVTSNSEEELYNGIKSILADKNLYLKYKNMAVERSNDFKLEKFIKIIEKNFIK